MNGLLMLIALVASKMEPENKTDTPIDYTPQPRKRRGYSRESPIGLISKHKAQQ